MWEKNFFSILCRNFSGTWYMSRIDISTFTFLYFGLSRSSSFPSFFSCIGILLSLSSTFYLSTRSDLLNQSFAYLYFTFSFSFYLCLSSTFFLVFYLSPLIFFVYNLLSLSAPVPFFVFYRQVGRLRTAGWLRTSRSLSKKSVS